MPLIHFAFGKLFRDQRKNEQIKSFVDYIVAPKALKAFVCPEFMPVLGIPGGKKAVPSSARDMGDGSVGFTEWIDSPPVSLLPNDVWMVSFVDIAIKKLRRWGPSEHYGRLGIAFTKAFRERMGIKRVTYYQYPDLARDPMVMALNRAQADNNEVLRQHLMTEVVHYRKPAFLWEEFNTLFAPLRLTKGLDGVDIEPLTYSRYEVGYNFQQEREARLVKDENDCMVYFHETDVLMIVVPDDDSKDLIEDFITNNWCTHPEVLVYPD